MAQIKDPLTGLLFTPSRSNQKHQNPANRIKYNNERAKSVRQIKSRVDKPLLKNFTALTEIIGNESEKIVHREFLLGRGFDFRFFTNHVSNGSKSDPAYYDFVISKVEDKPDYVKIKKL